MSPVHRARVRAALLVMLATVTTVTTALALPGTPAAAADPRVTAAQRLASPGVPGANNWTCRPSTRHPDPVVLVHGTLGTGAVSWGVLSPRLATSGRCVFALDYGGRGLGSIATSAGQLRTFVDGVRAATGAAQVDIVGHSQGGMMPRHFLRFLGGAPLVDDLIGLGPSNHGSESNLAEILGVVGACPACLDQIAGSDFLTRLNAGGDTVSGVDYTVIATRYDIAVYPYRTQFLSGPSNQVTNVTLQNRCPFDPAGHIGMPFNANIGDWVLNALDRNGPADPAFQPTCLH